MRKCPEPSREIREGKSTGHHLGASVTVGRIGACLSLHCACKTVRSDTGRHKGTGNLGSAAGSVLRD